VAASAGPEAEEVAVNALEKWLAEGAKKARKEGRDEGRDEGRREMLLKQLAAKFGPLPDSATARVQKASAAEVEAWTLRVLTAASLAEVFAEPRAKPRARR
jgi:flagellar biosynthesis/type III secretory pathway protein FliH